MKKVLYGLVSVCLAAVMFAGCSSTTTSTTSSKETTTVAVATTAAAATTTAGAADTTAAEKNFMVGFSAGFTKVQHWQLEVLGAQTAAKDLGVDFTYEYANGDPTKQIADIENMVEKGINMLIVGPADSKGIVPTINELMSKDVLVGTSDIGVTGVDVASHVASDNYAIGVTAANYVGKVLNGEGKIAIVGWAAASATADRDKGFTDTLKASFPKIEIITDQDVQSDRQVSLAACESIIQANSDIKLIFGCNAECALGAYAATQSVNRTDVLVVSVDSDKEVMDAILAKTNMVATVTQDPYTMGYQAMTNAVKSLKGEKVEDVAIPHELVTIENAAAIVTRDQDHLKTAS